LSRRLWSAPWSAYLTGNGGPVAAPGRAVYRRNPNVNEGRYRPVSVLLEPISGGGCCHECPCRRSFFERQPSCRPRYSSPLYIRSQRCEHCSWGTHDEYETPRRKFLHLAAGAVALPAFLSIAKAQAYPSRPVHIIAPFAAGGPSDGDSTSCSAEIDRETW
jgi:hypothetical protein